MKNAGNTMLTSGTHDWHKNKTKSGCYGKYQALAMILPLSIMSNYSDADGLADFLNSTNMKQIYVGGY